MDTAVLLRYLESRESNAERRAVEDWLALGDAQRSEFERLQRAWTLLGRAPEAGIDPDRLWVRIRRDIEEGTGVTAVPLAHQSDHSQRFRKPSGWKHNARKTMRVLAAAAAIGFAIVYAGSRLNGPADPSDRPMAAYATAAGELSRITLPDGSRAIISGASTLRVPEDFGGDHRDLFLDGEAYFEVNDPSGPPFRVQTSRMVVEDLGTRFMVRGFTEDAEESVAVAEGSVAVGASAGEAPVTLYASDLAQVFPTGQLVVTRDAAVDAYFAWTEGTARFEQVRLGEAARVIQRRFGVDLRIRGEELAARRFTGTVRAGTLYADLRAVALLLDAEYEREGSIVTLRSVPGSRAR